MKVGVIGCGLIGGSLLLALRRAGVEVLAVDSDETTRDALEALGIEAQESLGAALRECSLVVLALPLPALLSLLEPLGLLLQGSGAVLSDVAGVKALVQSEAERLLPKSVPFVGAHPMAGREVGGFASATESLFDHRSVAICPVEGSSPEALRLVEQMWSRLGLRLVHCSPEEHDEAVARVSHLPYLSACVTAFIAGEGSSLARELAAGGLRDTTRVSTDATLRFVAAENRALAPLARQAALLFEELATALERGERPDAFFDAAAQARRRLFPG